MASRSSRVTTSRALIIICSLFLAAPSLAVLASLGCSAVPDRSASTRAAAANEEVDAGDGGLATPTADRVEIVHGVPDRGRDPAVVAIRVGSDGLCSGALISPRLVLTARHCVSRTAQAIACPASTPQVFAPFSPSSLEILVGEDVVSARRVASGLSIITTGGVTLCDADIAVIVLDTAVTSVRPLPLRARGPASGDYLRAVGFGRPNDNDPAGVKRLREHVRVLSVSTAEFTVGEATCSGDSGGPAIDEDTSEVVGVVSRGGPTCEGKNVHNIYTRVDTYQWLMEEAFARVAEIDLDERIDAGSSSTDPKPAKRGTKTRPASDVGGPCISGSDCAAGICIKETNVTNDPDVATMTRQYCSRPCGSGDRCPTRYHCKDVIGLDEDRGTACINVR